VESPVIIHHHPCCVLGAAYAPPPKRQTPNNKMLLLLPACTCAEGAKHKQVPCNPPGTWCAECSGVGPFRKVHFLVLLITLRSRPRPCPCPCFETAWLPRRDT
jgi:hypothetical protein